MVVQPISVSVVIPTYNRADRLRNCLESLCQQSLPKEEFEVVVVDDGSPESMSSVVDGFRSRLNVTLIRQSNTGPAQARNNGVKESQAELIAFTDDDCRPRTDWLEKLVRAECENPGALVGGSTVNGLCGEILATTSQFIVDLVYLHFNKDPLNACFLTSNNMLCGKSQFIALNGFDNRFLLAGGEDRDYCDRWRAARAQIIWQKDALIDHFHSQTLRKFINLHFRYGIGAYLYQSNRRERGSGGMWEDLAFHQSLIGYIPRELFTRFPLVKAMQILFFMIVWQIVNALGFFYAFCTKKLTR